MTDEFRTSVRRYASQIRSLIATHSLAFDLQNETATSVRVDRCAILAGAINGPISTEPAAAIERLIELSRSDRLPSIRVIDSAGHARAAYRPAMVYAWLKAFQLSYETLPASEFGRWEEAARAWADLLESDLGATHWPAPTFPASAGDRWAEMVWDALALHVAGKVFVRDSWTDLAADAFGRLTRAQQPSGAFLTATPADQPETMWYHELQILHAAAGYAVQAEDRSVAAAVLRASEFHQNETQPDHATTQPWGLFALIWNGNTRPLADQLLHSVALQQPGSIDGLTLMLLADCLYCLGLFEG